MFPNSERPKAFSRSLESFVIEYLQLFCCETQSHYLGTRIAASYQVHNIYEINVDIYEANIRVCKQNAIKLSDDIEATKGAKFCRLILGHVLVLLDTLSSARGSNRI